MKTEVETGKGFINWADGGGVWKLLTIPRAEIDIGRGPVAHNLIWIDGGNVRRIDITLDKMYGRLEMCEKSDVKSLRDAIKSAPVRARKIINNYLDLIEKKKLP